jgi:hypothetical protein
LLTSSSDGDERLLLGDERPNPVSCAPFVPYRLPVSAVDPPLGLRPAPLRSWRSDSNRRPAVYKTAALPTELRQPAAECTGQSPNCERRLSLGVPIGAALSTAVEVCTTPVTATVRPKAPKWATDRAKTPRRARDVGWAMGMKMEKPPVSVAGPVVAGDQSREEDRLRRGRANQQGNVSSFRDHKGKEAMGQRSRQRITHALTLPRPMHFRKPAQRSNRPCNKTAALPTELRQPAAVCTAQLRRDGRTNA